MQTWLIVLTASLHMRGRGSPRRLLRLLLSTVLALSFVSSSALPPAEALAHSTKAPHPDATGPAPSTATQQWTQLAPTGTLPSARAGHSAVWDAAGRMLVFGGYNSFSPGSTALNDVWRYQPNSNSWIQLTLGGALPPARYFHSAVWDAADGVMLVFGGYRGGYTNDLWSYQPNGNIWTPLTPSGSWPSERSRHSAVWDAAGGRMLVFGGERIGGYFNDLWSYQPGSNSWTQLTPGGTLPPGRGDHSAVWDAAGGRMVVFGGSDGSFLNDLWSYQPSSNSWTQLTPSGFPPPPARYWHSAVWDAAAGRMLFFGGYASGLGRSNDLWSYDPSANTWIQLTPSGTLPVGRYEHSAVWDAAGSQMLVFGGDGGPYLNDLWSYPAAAAASVWAPLAGGPPGRKGHSAVWDPPDGQMLLFGGFDGTAGRNDLWRYRPAANSWEQLSPSGSPPPTRCCHSAVWDPVDQQMLIFGGLGAGGFLNDLWAYKPGADEWTPLDPSGDPPAGRGGHTAEWDSVGNQMLVFGGFDGGSVHNDLWSYDPSANRWTQLAPSGALPPARADHATAWDPVNRQMFMFGGRTSGSGTGNLNDLWVYRPNASSWFNLNPAGSLPSARAEHTAVWDSASNQMLVFGGVSSGGDLNDLWSYDPAGNSWAQVAPRGGPPAARVDASAVWDGTYRQMLLFGGVSGTTYFGDLWGYRPGVVPGCTLTQSASFTGGNMTLAYTLGANVPATWGLWMMMGGSIIPIVTAPLPVIDPPLPVGPFSFPFPAVGTVAFITALTTPQDGVLCWDWDLVDTGTPAAAAGTGAPGEAAPADAVPKVPSLELPNGVPGRR